MGGRAPIEKVVADTLPDSVQQALHANSKEFAESTSLVESTISRVVPPREGLAQEYCYYSHCHILHRDEAADEGEVGDEAPGKRLRFYTQLL